MTCTSPAIPNACLYTATVPKGKRASNITRWGIKHINDHYQKEWGADFKAKYPGRGITTEHIFAYTYAVLHNPAYREKYAIDLTRELPRLPLYRNFDAWAAAWGRSYLTCTSASSRRSRTG